MDKAVWLHVAGGGKYTIVVNANMEGTRDDVVVYRSIVDGSVWVSPFKEFHDGRFKRTDEMVSDAPLRLSEALDLMRVGAAGFDF